jgi:hypothetical protein
MRKPTDDPWRVTLHPLALDDYCALPAWAQAAVIELLNVLKMERDLDSPHVLDICRSFPCDGKTVWRVKERGGKVRACVQVVDGDLVLEYADKASGAARLRVVFVDVRSEHTYSQWLVRRVTALVG